MAIDALDIRMARLEGAYAQINERLGSLEHRLVTEISGLRTEMSSEIGAVRGEIGTLRGEFRTDLAELRRQMTTQFYWILALILGSILIPILRDLAR
jgi:hypothetical protein